MKTKTEALAEIELSVKEGRGANLRGADLRNANLCDSNLFNADLRDADLRGADLRGADLRDADLRDAGLRDADLRDADLRGADLRNAYLYGANLGFKSMLAQTLRIMGACYEVCHWVDSVAGEETTVEQLYEQSKPEWRDWLAARGIAPRK